MKKYYYDKEKALKQELYCLGINLDEKKIQNFVVYEGDSIFSGYPVVEGNILRVATLQELVNLGKLVLVDGEKIEDNKIVKVLQPDYYYRWNKNTFTWEVDENLLKDGDYIQDGKLITVEYDEGLGYLKRAWNKQKHVWYEGATDLEKAEDSYRQYMKLNNPIDIKKMTSQGIIDSYWEYIDSLEKYIDNTRAGVSPLGNIPLPNEKLVDFFNNRFIVGGRYE